MPGRLPARYREDHGPTGNRIAGIAHLGGGRRSVGAAGLGYQLLQDFFPQFLSLAEKFLIFHEQAVYLK
jgi:hypothetical protein